MMFAFALRAGLLVLALLSGSAATADEVKGVALVKAEDPIRGSIPNIVVAYGSVDADPTTTVSFQRDGQVLDIKVEIGERFNKGDPLLDFGASPAAVVAYEQAKTALTLEENTRSRTEQRLKLKLATQDELDVAEKAVSDAQLTKRMLEQQGSLTPLETLKAPFDGVVTVLSVPKGDRVLAGAPLMTLGGLDEIKITVGIWPSDRDKVRPGQTVQLQSNDPDAKPIQGSVRRVGGAIDPRTRLISTVINLPAGEALPGQPLRADIDVGKFEGWLVPRNAVGSDSKGSFIFQVDEEHAKRVNVNVIGSAFETSAVTGDINSEVKIVIVGGYQLADGDAVRVEEAATAQKRE